MNTVKIRNLTLGEGCPKICIPLMGHTRREILKEASYLKELPADLVEWRGDYYEDIFQPEKVGDVLSCLRNELGQLPILFTFRTTREGGSTAATPADYLRLNQGVLFQQTADLIDVECFSPEGVAASILADAHKNGVKVIGSFHDFKSTPSTGKMVDRFKRMQDMGVDITKIAVMPTCSKDVLNLLEASLQMQEHDCDRPFITIAMSQKGLISRFCGEFSGSAVSFGTIEKASAPGQIEAKALKTILELIHEEGRYHP